MTQDIYRRLQKKLDQYSMGFPETRSGIEIEILRYLFSEEDSELFLQLSPMLESPDQLAERVNRPVGELADQLENMSGRGLLFRLEKDGTVKYGAIPFIHGLFEFQVKDIQPDLARMVGKYLDEGMDRAIQQNTDYFLRPIPVEQSVEVRHNVAAYEDAAALLRSKSSIVVTECICRKRAILADEGCEKPLENCFMFGSMGQYYLDRDMGRKINVDEALDILRKSQEAGLVTQPATAQNPGGMCNCCGDCCGVLHSLNKLPKPADQVFSNYFVTVQSDNCTGCEICLDRCQMTALHMTDDEVVEVDLDRCIGCGLCVTDCPSEALSLIPKSPVQHQVPPSSTAEQMMKMAQKRGLV